MKNSTDMPNGDYCVVYFNRGYEINLYRAYGQDEYTQVYTYIQPTVMSLEKRA